MMQALVVIDQGNSEHQVFCDFAKRPAVGDVVVIDGLTCVIERVDHVRGAVRGHDLLVRCRLASA